MSTGAQSKGPRCSRGFGGSELADAKICYKLTKKADLCFMNAPNVRCMRNCLDSACLFFSGGGRGGMAQPLLEQNFRRDHVRIGVRISTFLNARRARLAQLRFSFARAQSFIHER